VPFWAVEGQRCVVGVMIGRALLGQVRARDGGYVGGGGGGVKGDVGDGRGAEGVQTLGDMLYCLFEVAKAASGERLTCIGRMGACRA
jgi:hypothetical protein